MKFIDPITSRTRFLWAACWFCILMVPAALQAQDEVSEQEWKQGYHGFNLLCSSVGLEHQSLTKWLSQPATSTVLVVLGGTEKVPFNVDAYLERGGAALLASDESNTEIVLRHGLGFISAQVRAIDPKDSLNAFVDCPIITDVRLHPVTENVASLVTNRPGVLRQVNRRSQRVSTLAYLPPLVDSNRRHPFISAVENRQQGRLVCIADDSIFSNQMLLYHDNARLAQQALLWLADGQRDHVLVIANGKVQSAVDPSGVEIKMPQPTRKEVIDALKNLPPSAMLEFANAVATVVEDENMVNEFIQTNIDKVRKKKLDRALIFVGFGLVCLVSVFTYVMQKKLLRRTASEVAVRRVGYHRPKLAQRRLKKMEKAQRAQDRKTAVGVLLDTFCLSLANRTIEQWRNFPKGWEIHANVALVSDPACLLAIKRLRAISRKYYSKTPSYWTGKRLEQVEREVAHGIGVVRRNMPDLQWQKGSLEAADPLNPVINPKSS